MLAIFLTPYSEHLGMDWSVVMAEFTIFLGSAYMLGSYSVPNEVMPL